jgi:hypothetical protein
MSKLLLLPLAALALVGGPAHGAVAPGIQQPAVVVESFRAVVRSRDGADSVAWQAPERFAARRVRGSSLFGRYVERDGWTIARFSATSPASVLRGTYPAAPDGASRSDELRRGVDFVLAEARAGKRILVPARLGGRPAWRARVFLRANECAGLSSGRLDLWLDRRTLLPLRRLEVRPGVNRRIDIAYSGLNRPLPRSTWTPPPIGNNPYRADFGFVRTTPGAAARRLPYRPLLPARVPAGFRLAVSGWAPRSGVTGAEGSNPRYRALFAAVYRRGPEHVDVTQRLAGLRGWLGDPFGQECGFQVEDRATIRGATAVYGAGPGIVPHLYWRQGRLLLTVSGPFPKRELVAIARSLAPVSSPS